MDKRLERRLIRKYRKLGYSPDTLKLMMKQLKQKCRVVLRPIPNDLVNLLQRSGAEYQPLFAYPTGEENYGDSENGNEPKSQYPLTTLLEEWFFDSDIERLSLEMAKLLILMNSPKNVEDLYDSKALTSSGGNVRYRSNTEIQNQLEFKQLFEWGVSLSSHITNERMMITCLFCKLINWMMTLNVHFMDQFLYVRNIMSNILKNTDHVNYNTYALLDMDDSSFKREYFITQSILSTLCCISNVYNRRDPECPLMFPNLPLDYIRNESENLILESPLNKYVDSRRLWSAVCPDRSYLHPHVSRRQKTLRIKEINMKMTSEEDERKRKKIPSELIVNESKDKKVKIETPEINKSVCQETKVENRNFISIDCGYILNNEHEQDERNEDNENNRNESEDRTDKEIEVKRGAIKRPDKMKSGMGKQKGKYNKTKTIEYDQKKEIDKGKMCEVKEDGGSNEKEREDRLSEDNEIWCVNVFSSKKHFMLHIIENLTFEDLDIKEIKLKPKFFKGMKAEKGAVSKSEESEARKRKKNKIRKPRINEDGILKVNKTNNVMDFENKNKSKHLKETKLVNRNREMESEDKTVEKVDLFSVKNELPKKERPTYEGKNAIEGEDEMVKVDDEVEDYKKSKENEIESGIIGYGNKMTEKNHSNVKEGEIINITKEKEEKGDDWKAKENDAKNIKKVEDNRAKMEGLEKEKEDRNWTANDGEDEKESESTSSRMRQDEYRWEWENMHRRVRDDELMRALNGDGRKLKVYRNTKPIVGKNRKVNNSEEKDEEKNDNGGENKNVKVSKDKKGKLGKEKKEKFTKYSKMRTDAKMKMAQSMKMKEPELDEATGYDDKKGETSKGKDGENTRQKHGFEFKTRKKWRDEKRQDRREH